MNTATNKHIKLALTWDAWTISSLILVLLGVAAVFFPWPVLDGVHIAYDWVLHTRDFDDLGSFITGVSTPFFGLATIVMLVRTYSLQKQQLIEAREDGDNQLRLIQKQRFDDNFFRLLENHQRIIEGMDLHKTHGGAKSLVASKRDCFRTFYLRMKQEVKRKSLAKTEHAGKPLTIDEVNTIYDETQDYYKADLHHYFRFLYHVLKFVKNAEGLDEDEKYKYTSILRATLSPYELVLVFYNCLHEFGDSHFKPLVEEFSFLKNMDTSLIFRRSQLKEYDKLARASSSERPVLLALWRQRQARASVPPTSNPKP